MPSNCARISSKGRSRSSVVTAVRVATQSNAPQPGGFSRTRRRRINTRSTKPDQARDNTQWPVLSRSFDVLPSPRPDIQPRQRAAREHVQPTLLKVQSTSPTSGHFRRFSARWTAVWDTPGDSTRTDSKAGPRTRATRPPPRSGVTPLRHEPVPRYFADHPQLRMVAHNLTLPFCR